MKNPKSSSPAKTGPSNNQLAIHQQVTTIFDPNVVQQYSKMVPDAPERILKVFEANSQVERELRRLPFYETRRRDWMGYTLTASILIATCFFAWLGKPWLYGSTLTVFLGIVVHSFIVKPKKKQ